MCVRAYRTRQGDEAPADADVPANTTSSHSGALVSALATALPPAPALVCLALTSPPISPAHGVGGGAPSPAGPVSAPVHLEGCTSTEDAEVLAGMGSPRSAWRAMSVAAPPLEEYSRCEPGTNWLSAAVL
jgi:hypothetical protein